MAAAYAHITLVDRLCREQLDSIPNLTPSIRLALQNYTPFCKLGAISPDCPYVVGNTGATGYANVMHYLRTADFVRYAIPRLISMNFGQADTRACLAWIFGYAAHLVTDLTVHPVISRKFGDYALSAANRKAHRLCELHQDVYLYSKLAGQEIHGSNFLAFSTLDKCSVNGNLNKLHPAILKLWTYILQQYPPSEIKRYLRLPRQSLDPNNWFATYLLVFQKIVTKGGSFFQKKGLGYPSVSALNPKYLENLPTASGDTIGYDKLFAIAATNVKTCWSQLALALDTNRPTQFSLPNANLDTGRADATKQLVFNI